MWTTTTGVLDRDNGALTLAEGVWTDYGWITECVRRARAAGDDIATAIDWLQHVFVDLSRVDGRAFARPAGKKDYWRWVDEHPVDVPARNRAASGRRFSFTTAWGPVESRTVAPGIFAWMSNRRFAGAPALHRR